MKLADIVRAVVHKYQLPADRCWAMTVSDMMLMLREPEQNERTDNAFVQRMMCLALDKRLNVRKKLSLQERIELNEWVAKLTS